MEHIPRAPQTPRIPELFWAIAILVVMGALAIFALKDNSYTADESARLGAGFSYLTEGNMRLNPEDPPLGKDIAALPLLFQDIKLPRALSTLIPGDIGRGDSFTFGIEFLFHQKIPAEKVLFWPRVLMVLSAMALGLLVFLWSRRLGDSLQGLLALFFFCFSPTVLAFSSYVTLDMLAALGFLFATYGFLSFLKQPSWRNTALSGVALGLALQMKFNLLPMIPYWIFLACLWAYVSVEGEFWPRLGRLSIRMAALFGIAGVWFFVIYALHFVNYPVAQQQQELTALLSEVSKEGYTPLFTSLAKNPVLRVLVQIFVGVAYRVLHSVSFSYFLGKGIIGGTIAYFPVAYFLKETLAFHFFTIAALTAFVSALRAGGSSLRAFIAENFDYVALGCWLAGYLALAIFWLKVNVGLRHLAPVFPALHILVAAGVRHWLGDHARQWKLVVSAILACWMLLSVLGSYPSFITYFNEAAGGSGEGYRYLVDSNYELGQDALRLARWAEENKIPKLKIPRLFSIVYNDLIGVKEGEWFLYSYRHYLGSRMEELPKDTRSNGWIAVPATLLQWGRADPHPGPRGWGSDSFRWLNHFDPVARINDSIFVYHIEELPPDTPEDHKALLDTSIYHTEKMPSAETFFDLGYAYIAAGMPEQGIAPTLRAIQLKEAFPQAHNNLGLIYMNLKRWNEAIEHLQRAVELDPKFELAWNNLKAAKENRKASK